MVPTWTGYRRGPGQSRHASDNREENVRAAAALRHAAEGVRVALVSGGDPGVFAMAAAVCAAIESGPEAWRRLELAIVPGITAMLAVAARVGAPLGHDFCALSLSDNLKPWDLIERRLDAAAGAGFVIALYNPVSRARPWQLGAAFDRLARLLPASTPVIFGRAVGRLDEHIAVAELGAAKSVPADMATLVIVGSAETRVVRRDGRAALVYTPRAAAGADPMIKPRHGRVDGFGGFRLREHRPPQHDDRNTQRAGRRDLAVGRAAAAVLGDHDSDVMLFEQFLVGVGIERPAGRDVMRARHRERRLNRIDAADKIKMLGRLREWRDIFAAKRQENTLRRGTERANCIQRISGFDPAVPGNGNPGGTAQRQQRNPGLSGGGCGVGGHDGRVGVGRIDQDIDVVIGEVAGETVGAAEAAAPHRDRLACRRGGTAGQRQRDGKVRPAGQAAGQFARFRGAAENENAHAAP